MTDTQPTGFEDLKPTELYRSALEDFAIPVDEADKNKKRVLLAAFVESGVTWADYLAQHPELAPAPEQVVEANLESKLSTGGVITSSDVSNDTDSALTVEVEEAPVVIHTATAPKPQVQDKYLIKMVRDNPRFDIKGHSFTRAHPYALVTESVADYLLTKEDGFQMASPSELREFYG